MKLIEEIMSRDVLTIGQDESIFNAAKEMSQHGISCLVIVDNGEPHGIITRRDILEKVFIKKVNADETKVKDVMTHPVVTIKNTDNLIIASATLNLRKIKQLPVVKESTLVGIVTQTDIVHNINAILGFDLKDIDE